MSIQHNSEALSSINDEIKDFVECRARELDAMMQSLSGNVTGGNRTPMQLLPRHMRRRAANHDVRRLPLSKRLAAKKELDSRPMAKRKPPSRRHRRRPANLLEEYARRKRKHVWLETHIWHAKRFHMTERWGYRLPNYPNDRGVRAVYRDSVRRCVLLDMSYYCCIELCGTQSSILDSLARLTSADTGPTVGAKCNLSGSREGRTVFYRADCYPFSAIGEVTFMWRCSIHPDVEEVSERRTLWIWTHPSCHYDIIEELKSVFHLTDGDCQTLPAVAPVQGGKDAGVEPKTGCTSSFKRKILGNELNSDAKRLKSEDGSRNSAVSGCLDRDAAIDITDTEIVNSANCNTIVKTSNEPQASSCLKASVKITKQAKLAGSKTKLGNVDCPGISKMSVTRQVYDNGSVRLESLKDDLCRFRLIGPTSHRVVSEALDFIKAESSIKSPSASDECAGTSLMTAIWWKDYYKNNERYLELKDQLENWNTSVKQSSADDFPLHSILSLVVRDPRLSLPNKRTPAKQETSVMMNAESDCRSRLMQNLSTSASPIWERAVREAVKLSKQTTAQLNDLRSLCLVPGTTPDLGDSESRIPIMLVQRPTVTGSLMVSKHSDVGFGSGWDVILPTNWAMPFWIAFIYRGAKAAGLRDLHSLAMESGALAFPDSCPDTSAASEASKSLAIELQASYNRRPPAKRCNYLKMGILSPFHCPWPQIVQEWSNDNRFDPPNTSSFLCFRNRKLLRKIAESFAPSNLCSTQRDQNSKTVMPDSQNLSRVLCLDSFPSSKLSIVQVTVVVSGRGVPSKFSLICLPTASDLLTLSGSAKSQRKRVIASSELKEPIHKSEAKNSSSEGLSTDADVVGKASRRTFGFIIEGGFSHSLGRGFGVGFVTVPGLLQLMDENRSSRWKSLTVLVRSTTSLHYHAAELSLVV